MEFKFHYDSEHDIFYIRNAERKVKESVEFSEDIILDLDEDDNVIGVEIFYASEFFNTFNKEINREFLMRLKEATLDYKEFRNMWFIVLILKTESKQIFQPLPPLRKSEYTSPLIASCE